MCLLYFLMIIFFERTEIFFHGVVTVFFPILLPSLEHAGLITKLFTARFNSEFEWGGSLLESSTFQRRYNIQHNDIQHNDIQHKEIQHNDKVLLCWVSLCWVSLYWTSLCWVSLCWTSLCWMSLWWVSWRPFQVLQFGD
jgi:hypothetical protein